MFAPRMMIKEERKTRRRPKVSASGTQTKLIYPSVSTVVPAKLAHRENVMFHSLTKMGKIGPMATWVNGWIKVYRDAMAMVAAFQTELQLSGS